MKFKLVAFDLDLFYAWKKHFGWDLESKVRSVLDKSYFGELPVGNAIVVKTGIKDTPFLISAPTMRVPSNVSETVNAYLAFKAIIQACLKHNEKNEQKLAQCFAQVLEQVKVIQRYICASWPHS